MSLSLLTGSSEQEEARVLEFLDRAEALGLVRLDFQINDETMSFLSKRVVEIAYGTLNQNRREELHERVGNYQEKLFEQRLLTSASLLAYHFKRSADRVKAQRYEKVQFAHDRAVFDAREAQWYADNDYFEYAEALKPESLPLVPDVLRTLLAATRSIRLYPEESQPLRSARQHAQSAIDALLAANEALSLSRAEAGLRANGVELDATEFQTLADSFTALLDGADLQSVTFRRGVSEQEMICLLEIISKTRTESLGRGYWKQFAAEHGFEHIALRQVRYSRIKSKSTATIQTPEASVEDELTPGELAQIPDLLRVFLRAAKNIKLYPAGSQPLITVVQHFHQSLKSALSRLPVLTLAAVNESLLVNGAKLSSLELVVIVESFVAYIDSVGLKSLSFFADITPVEVEIFLGALRERPANVDERYWEEVARTHALPGLAFNTQRYALDSLRGASKIEPTPTLPALGDEIVLNATGVGEMGAHGEMQAHREIEADTGEEPFESPLNGFVTVGRDLLLKGDRSGFDR